MKKTLAIALMLAAFALCAPLGAFAQTILTMTTLSAALNAPSDVPSAGSGLTSCFLVASATGITGPSLSNPTVPAANSTGTTLYVDREAISVTSVSSTTVCGVRGADSTAARAHASGALVFVIPDYLDTYSGTPYGTPPAVPSGSCTRSKELVLPRIQFISGLISDCVGGQWTTGDSLNTTRNSGTVLYAPNPGGTIYTSLNSTGTTLAATTMYCTEVQLPYAKYVTGLEVLNGTTVGTDNHLVALYDATGNLIANSAVAGVLAATASEYQKIAFTTPYYLVGPGQYFGCMQTNGTTATVRMLVTQVQDNYLTKGVTGQTFGTIPATITVPTTFTTAVGPYFSLY
jgi:hypothetical protein